MSSLTAAERETVVNACDADDHITVWTAQRPVITRLRKLACAELLEEGFHGGSPWARFKLPAESLRFRNPPSEEFRARRREVLAARGGFNNAEAVKQNGGSDGA